MTTTQPPTEPSEPLEAAPPTLDVGYDERWIRIDPSRPFAIGRAADLSIDDNAYLHRRLLELSFDRFWTIANVGDRLGATISDVDGTGIHAWLSPGAVLPIVMRTTDVRFTAGPSTYRITLSLSQPLMTVRSQEAELLGNKTLAPVELTDLQRALVVSLAEPTLRSPTKDATVIPPSAEAARRLGWTITKFNRQLDAVCAKLDRSGVAGLHGELGGSASNRRSRLVEYAIATRLVTRDDLSILDEPE